MDVKPPLPATSTVRAPTASAPELGSRSPASAAAALDRIDIRPLDIPAALQILLAEVRASFELTALDLTAPDTETGTSILADNPSQTARAVVQVFLQALTENIAGAPLWIAALARVETALQQGLDRGIAANSGW